MGLEFYKVVTYAKDYPTTPVRLICGIKDKEEMNCPFHIPESNTAIVIPHKEDKHHTVICFREMMDNKGNISKVRFKMPNVNVAFDILSEEKTGVIFTMTVME